MTEQITIYQQQQTGAKTILCKCGNSEPWITSYTLKKFKLDRLVKKHRNTVEFALTCKQCLSVLYSEPMMIRGPDPFEDVGDCEIMVKPEKGIIDA